MFFCAMMGRTSLIMTTDSSVLEDAPISAEHSSSFDQDLGLRESMHAFSFMEKIVNEIYTKRTVPLGSLQKISFELQEASSRIPLELRAIPASMSMAYHLPEVRRHILRNASVACNYYFSMLLLTRPFLTTSLRAKRSQSSAAFGNAKQKINDLKNNSSVNTKLYSDIAQGAMLSLDSAIKMLRLLYELMTANILFNNMPLAV
jgi:hypothetical protein